MALGIFARFRGSASTLDADLKRITESGVIDVPKELLDIVVEAARVGQRERCELMAHLRSCLAEPMGRRWRRIHAAMVLVEELARNGPQELLVETSQGLHFDLVQRLSLLEHFEYSVDRRAQNMIRNKANAVRGELVTRLQVAGDDECAAAACLAAVGCGEPVKETASTCSTGPLSIEGGSNGSGHSPSSSGVGARPPGRMILNGVVAVGHSDDTTDEESSDGEGPKKAVQYQTKEQRRQRRKAGGAAGSDSEGSEDGAAAARRPQAPAVAKAAAAASSAPAPAPVDLLEL